MDRGGHVNALPATVVAHGRAEEDVRGADVEFFAMYVREPHAAEKRVQTIPQPRKR